jgi:hypothetical protein
LYDFGRAASEHVEVLAPDGTFISGGLIYKRDVRVPTRARYSLTRQHHYLSGRQKRDPGMCILNLRLVADPRGFLSPLRALAVFSSFLMLLLTSLQAFANAVLLVDGSLDAFTALMLFLPALLLPYIFASGEHDVRWKMLSPWRLLAFGVFSPVPVAFVMLAFPSGDSAQWVWFALLTVMLMIVLVLHLSLERDASAISSQYRRAQFNEVSMAPWGARD